MFLGISKTLKKMGGFRLHLGIKMNTWYGLIIGFFIGIFYLFYYAFVAACWVLYGIAWCFYHLVVWWIALFRTLKEKWQKGVMIGVTAAIVITIAVVGAVMGTKDTGEVEAAMNSTTESTETAETTTEAEILSTTVVTTTKKEPTSQTTQKETTSKTQRVYILNTDTKIIHNQSCHFVKKIASENYAETKDFDKAVSDGYTSCGSCHPSGY